MYNIVQLASPAKPRLAGDGLSPWWPFSRNTVSKDIQGVNTIQQNITNPLHWKFVRRLVKTSSHTSPNMFVGRMLMLSIPRDEGWWRGIKGSNVWEDSSQVDIETHRNSTWSRPCCYNLGTRIPAGLPCKNQLNRLTDFGLFFLWFPNLKNQCKKCRPIMDSYPSKICPEKTKATWCLGCRYLCWRVGCPSDLLVCWHDASDSQQVLLASVWKWWISYLEMDILGN